MLKTMTFPIYYRKHWRSSSAPRRFILLRCCCALLCCGLSIALQAHDNHDHHQPGTAVNVSEGLTLVRDSLARFEQTGGDDLLILAQRVSNQLLDDGASSPDILYLAARAAQAGHQFERAHKLLQQLLKQRPQHNSARLLQSTLFSVQGHHQEAHRACRKLRDASLVVTLVCKTAAMNAPNPDHQSRLEELLDKNVMNHHSVVGDLAIKNADYAAAEKHYERALALHPTARLRTAICNVYLNQGKNLAVLELTERSPRALPLTVKRLVALTRSNRPLTEEANQLNREFELQRQRGDFTHGREMAEYYLEVLNKPSDAKEIMQVSLQFQQEHEDWQLLARINAALG